MLGTVPILLAAGLAICAEPSQLGSMDFFRRASEQLALGHDVQALGGFRKALSVDPDFKPAQYNLASTYLRLGQIEQALAAASPEKCKDSRCQDVISKANELKTLLEEQTLEEDNDCYLFAQMLELAPKSVEILKSQAQCFFSKGRSIEAIRALTQVVQIDRSDSISAAQAAVGSFVLLDQRQQGLQILRQCVSYNDDEATVCKKATKQLRALQKLIEKQPVQKIKLSAVTSETHKLLKDHNIPRTEEEGMLVENLRRKRCKVLAERSLWEPANKVCALVRDLEPEFPPAMLVQAHLEYQQNNKQQALELVSKIVKEFREGNGDPDMRTIAQLAAQLHDEIMAERHQPRQPQQQPDKDLYKVLGVDKKADKKEIRKAYRQLSKQYHPDKYKGTDMDSNQVMEKMQEINEAYEILSNDDKRRDYDDQNSGGGGGGFPGGGPGFQGFQGFQGRAGRPGGFAFQGAKPGGGGAFQQFDFSNLFRNGRG